MPNHSSATGANATTGTELSATSTGSAMRSSCGASKKPMARNMAMVEPMM